MIRITSDSEQFLIENGAEPSSEGYKTWTPELIINTSKITTGKK
jgi:hypothetical protein